ncbi:MAG: hypothetical protein IJ600_11890 [Lachnospiraceae bacterium]|nr:hypothetical protein [Lachnospiraceae bacterium]
MACFLVPATEAIVVAAAGKRMKKDHPFTGKVKWLGTMLGGGSALLAFEHVWHGEVVPWFPFLTAAADPADTAEMLHEMSTVGVGMTVVVTMTWLAMVGISNYLEKLPKQPEKMTKA